MIDAGVLAHEYRRLVQCFGIQLLLTLVWMAALAADVPGTALSIFFLVTSVGMLATLIGTLVYGYRTARALNSSVPWLWSLAMLFPCVNVISLLALSSNATRACRANGIPVGFLGPKL